MRILVTYSRTITWNTKGFVVNSVNELIDDIRTKAINTSNLLFFKYKDYPGVYSIFIYEPKNDYNMRVCTIFYENSTFFNLILLNKPALAYLDSISSSFRNIMKIIGDTFRQSTTQVSSLPEI